LIEQFRLEDVVHSPAFFDVKKLRHMNGDTWGHSPEEFLKAAARGCDVEHCVAPERPQPGWSESSLGALYAKVAPLVQERVATSARFLRWWSSSS